MDFYSWNNEAMVANFNAYFCPNLFLQSEFDVITLIWIIYTNRETPAKLIFYFYDFRHYWINLIKGPSNLPVMKRFMEFWVFTLHNSRRTTNLEYILIGIWLF